MDGTKRGSRKQSQFHKVTQREMRAALQKCVLKEEYTRSFKFIWGIFRKWTVTIKRVFKQRLQMTQVRKKTVMLICTLKLQIHGYYSPHQPLLWRAEMFRRLQNFIKPSIHALNYLTNKKESPRHRLSQYNVFRGGQTRPYCTMSFVISVRIALMKIGW